MKKLIVVLAALGMFVAMLPGVQAGPGPLGYSSDNVEQVTHIPFESATTTGANFFEQGKNKYMIVTGWSQFSIYDVTDPAAPAIVGTPHPFGFKFENEDVSTNGRIMLFSESLPGNNLHIYDIEDIENPTLISSLPGAGQHTSTCILDCKWAYGSNGAISDLRNPAEPKLMKEKWTDGLEGLGGLHDITEVAPGLLISASQPMVYLDARSNPLKPKLIAMGEPNEQVGEAPVHSVLWPNKGKDKFILVAGESWAPTNGTARCTEDRNQGFSTWDGKSYKKTRTFTKIDTWKGYNGTIQDGGSALNAPFGCSSHWFDYHDTFKNGGLVAVAWYSNGTRILDVDGKGQIEEAGWFLPAAGAVSAAYWVDKEYIYSVDYQRGIDVLRYTDKV